MLKAVQGIYRDGKIELAELPPEIKEARVVVTFLPAEEDQPGKPPLTDAEINELRWKLQAWEDDWNAPGMESYDAL